MIDPKRPVKVIHTGRPNPVALRQLVDYIIDCAIASDKQAKKESALPTVEPNRAAQKAMLSYARWLKKRNAEMAAAQHEHISESIPQ